MFDDRLQPVRKGLHRYEGRREHQQRHLDRLDQVGHLHRLRRPQCDAAEQQRQHLTHGQGNSESRRRSYPGIRFRSTDQAENRDGDHRCQGTQQVGGQTPSDGNSSVDGHGPHPRQQPGFDVNCQRECGTTCREQNRLEHAGRHQEQCIVETGTAGGMPEDRPEGQHEQTRNHESRDD